MPPPPPRPPPGPPPPPTPAFSSHQPAAKPPASGPTDRSAVLLDIQKGARLKKVDRSQIKDRSSPLVPGGGGASAAPSHSPVGSSSTNASRNHGARGENGTNGTASAGMLPAPPAGLGGLFANGMPTLKRTGIRKDSPSDENTSPPSQPMTNSNSSNKFKTSPPAPLVTPNGPSSRNFPNSPSGGLPPTLKPATVPSSQRRLSGSEFEKPPPNPKPSVIPGSNPPAPPNFNHVTSGSATMHIQRTTERPGIPTMSLQKPKHPPPPLPPGPPPTRNISQTMPRPVKHQRPALPVDMAASPPTPPPVPGRPPSFREQRVRGAPQPPLPPSGYPLPGNSASPMVPPSGYPLPPNLNGGHPRPAFSLNGADVADNGRGLINNVAQQRPAPPSRPPATNGALGIPQSASVHSLPGSPAAPVRPPKRHDSLTTVTQDQGGHMAALSQVITRNGQPQPPPPSQPGKMAPGRPGSSPKMSTISSAQNFEAKFNFHRLNELPQPLSFSGMPKTYPSAKTRAASRPTAPAPPVH